MKLDFPDFAERKTIFLTLLKGQVISGLCIYLGLLLLVKDEVEVRHDLPEPVECLVDHLHALPLLGVGGLPPVFCHPGRPPARVTHPPALLQLLII